MSEKHKEVESVTREYYNSDSADRFYETIWGGEDIHIGLYESESESIFDASRKTVERMAREIPGLNKDQKVVDVGAGYGGSARFLAKHYGCHVTCLNLSEVQNRRNRKLNEEGGWSNLIDVVDGSFEELPFPAEAFDVGWSQDAILHSGQREKVLREVDRVLKKGGYFVFTDPMQSDDCPAEALKPVLERIHLDSMGSPGFYREVAAKLGWKEIRWIDFSGQLVNHYSRVRQQLVSREEDAVAACGREYVERMKKGLEHWVETGKRGHLQWGIFVFQK